MGSIEGHSSASEHTSQPVARIYSSELDSAQLPPGSGEITAPAGLTVQDIEDYEAACRAGTASPAVVVAARDQLVVRERPIQPEQPAKPAAPPLLPHEQRAAEIRRTIMQQVGMYHNTTGINVDRAEHFAGALGLRLSPDRLIISPRYLPATVQALGRAGVESPGVPEGGARYLPELGLTLINRIEYNLSNAEQQVVHEGVHSTAGIIPGLRPLKNISTPSDAPDLTPQWGLITMGGGQLLEEGFARITQHEYSRQAQLGPSRTYEERLRRADQPRGPYTYMREDHPYAPAAMGWGVMFAHSPSLIDAVLRSRRDPAAVSDVAKGIDAIKPGLYSTLVGAQRHTYGDSRITSFSDGLAHILEATGMTSRDFPAISNDGPFVHYIDDKIQRYTRRTGYTFR